MNLSTYFKNRDMRLKTPYTILPNGKGYWITPLGKMTDKKFNEKYPVGLITKDTGKGDNSDRRKAWMTDKKSY